MDRFAVTVALILTCGGTTLAGEAGVPLPPPRPTDLGTSDPAPTRTEADGDLPLDEIACRERLTGLGATFSPQPGVTGPGACGVAFPIALERLSTGVAVTGRPTVSCRLAEALATWSRDGLAATSEGATVRSVSVGTSYECRGRNHADTGPLSEHAYANAVDIAGFELSDGRKIAVGSAVDTALQDRLRASACKVFMTVLGPGSPGHGEHWHFDMRQRRNDYRICQ